MTSSIPLQPTVRRPPIQCLDDVPVYLDQKCDWHYPLPFDNTAASSYSLEVCAYIVGHSQVFIYSYAQRRFVFVMDFKQDLRLAGQEDEKGATLTSIIADIDRAYVGVSDGRILSIFRYRGREYHYMVSDTDGILDLAGPSSTAKRAKGSARLLGGDRDMLVHHTFGRHIVFLRSTSSIQVRFTARILLHSFDKGRNTLFIVSKKESTYFLKVIRFYIHGNEVVCHRDTIKLPSWERKGLVPVAVSAKGEVAFEGKDKAFYFQKICEKRGLSGPIVLGNIDNCGGGLLQFFGQENTSIIHCGPKQFDIAYDIRSKDDAIWTEVTSNLVLQSMGARWQETFGTGLRAKDIAYCDNSLYIRIGSVEDDIDSLLLIFTESTS